MIYWSICHLGKMSRAPDKILILEPSSVLQRIGYNFCGARGRLKRSKHLIFFCYIIYVANSKGFTFLLHDSWDLFQHSLILQVQGYKQIKAEGLKGGDGGRGGVDAPTEVPEPKQRRERKNEEGRVRRLIQKRGGKKRHFFLNPFEAKRLNRNFLLSGAMQGPNHFLCFALMCLQREEGRLNTALPHARKHSSATFSWLRLAVDLCAKDTETRKQPPPLPPPTVSHSTHAFRGHLNFTPDSCEPPHSQHIGVISYDQRLCFYLEFGRAVVTFLR